MTTPPNEWAQIEQLESLHRVRHVAGGPNGPLNPSAGQTPPATAHLAASRASLGQTAALTSPPATAAARAGWPPTGVPLGPFYTPLTAAQSPTARPGSAYKLR